MKNDLTYHNDHRQLELNFLSLKGIMAMSKNRCIGKNNTMPWHHPEDFKWFKEFTMGQTLILGWRTFATLPKLKGRKACVIDDYFGEREYDTTPEFINRFDKVTFTHLKWYNWEEYKFHPDNWVGAIVAGGKKTYQTFMPCIGEFYVTHIDRDYDGDTYMPEFEHLFRKQEVVRTFDFGKVIKYTK